MINWRNGKAGFVGGLKYIIKGVFQFAHSATSVSVTAPTTSFAIRSNINTDGSAVRSNMVSTLAIESTISADGQGVRSNMDNTGLGLESGF